MSRERLFATITSAKDVKPELPRPLMRELPPADPFPIDALGGVLAPAARAIHDRVQAPQAICGQSVLAAATLAVQGHADVELPTGQKRPLTNFYLTIAATGERKTSVDTEALAPVRKREAALHEEYGAKLLEYENSRLAWEKAREAAIRNAKPKGNRAAIKFLLDQLGPAPIAPLAAMITCPEPTYEGLCKAFQIGQPSLGIFASEGGQFIGGHGMSDEAKLRTAAGLSAAWDGEPMKRVRVGDTLPAKARQIYYQARPKIMALTDDKELQYGYFSQTLLPDYIEEHGVDWDVVYDARGTFEEPHTNRRIGCGTIEVRNYLKSVKQPYILPATFASASVDVIGPSSGNISAIFFCEKEGFGPLFKAVNLANRYDLFVISSKGQSVTAARQLIDTICGEHDLPLFVAHDFDVAGFSIFATLQRDTRRYQFSNAVEVVDLGLRLADIEGLEREPAAATKTSVSILRAQLAANGATSSEIDILINERVELNALTSDALIAMIETKLTAYGLKKVIPDEELLAETYRAFRRSQLLRERFEEMEEEFEEEADAIEIPTGLNERVGAILDKHDDLRWDDAVQLVLDETQLDRVRADKEKAKKKSGDFTSAGEDDED